MKSNKLVLLIAAFIGLMGCNSSKQESSSEVAKKPNILLIYLDDLGYGDMGAYGAATNLKTPNMDFLANNGVQFSNGYATSATCTPSRFGLITGTYPWRNEKARILPGSAPLIISPEAMTLPKMLQKEGYATGVVGKWHLGLGDGNMDWNKTINLGPNQVGFDESYIMAATQDRVPTVFIDNGNVVGLDPNDPIQVSYKENFEGEPTAITNPELVKMKWHHGHNNSVVNGIPRIGFMKGGESAKWDDYEMADHFLVKAKDYIKKHKDEPFFLYYAMQQPHVPRTPHPRFEGKSGMGPRGDAIIEADWCIGEIMKTLEEQGVLDNTLVIFSSDNGPVLNDGYYDDAVEKLGDHKPAGVLRGGKYSLFEAGARVPFLTYWKGKITPMKSDAIVCQMDLLTSIASLIGSDIKTDDSENVMDALLGESKEGRIDLVLEATSRTAYRRGDWLLIPSYKGPAELKKVAIEIGNDPEIQLYNLKEDPSQQNNLAKDHKDKVAEMMEAFTKIRGDHSKGTKNYKLR
ncbi:arylsulfatase [Flammeovirga sp. MY04]|uniref:sulfatase family protein n=1 Tax=Flammeovirga sp. MY04 TaxID=1191459 RepID=UPI0008062203|nr:arylsulfatase [Flammeovirga sp. MY04]ANQ51599.1 arylsulfatase [Flammeovirga sp. MY04]